MSIDNITIGEFMELKALMSVATTETGTNNGMIGKYVVVRCKDAGVHAGILKWHNGRECGLEQSRRLWHWIAKKCDFLSGVALYGLKDGSKVGPPCTIHLTENCEIIECTPESAATIQAIASHNE